MKIADSSQQNGFFVVAVLILILILAHFLIPYIPIDNKFEYKKFLSEVNEFQKGLNLSDSAKSDRLTRYLAKRYDTLSLFAFDPNNATPDQWRNLGMTNKQIKSIENYLNRGGAFYSKADFARIYGVRRQQYEYLAPYISLPETSTRKKRRKYNYRQFDIKPKRLHIFDPNDTLVTNFDDLGISPRQTAVLCNYLKRGGQFRTKADFQKMYCISDKQFKILEPYIEIDTLKLASKKKYDTQKDEIIFSIDLNAATIEELCQVRGIGKSFAERIIKFRNEVGGYIKKEQLKDIYGIKPEIYDKIEKHFNVVKISLKKLNINFDERDELAKHPYITWKQASIIIEYRINHGRYSSFDQLFDLIGKRTLNKIKPYLEL